MTNKIIRKEPRDTDIAITHLFPNRGFCPLDDSIIVKYNSSLAILIRAADKAVAHMTSIRSQEEDHNKFPEARKAVYDLVLKYIPEINKDKIWWYTQISKI